ncbi:MAG: hypothetical protein MJZ02_05390 [Paludibacteraceae bacterium]|nr:hypothetical protein [Paludibacteraceae bacterium]
MELKNMKVAEMPQNEKRSVKGGISKMRLIDAFNEYPLIKSGLKPVMGIGVKTILAKKC